MINFFPFYHYIIGSCMMAYNFTTINGIEEMTSNRWSSLLANALLLEGPHQHRTAVILPCCSTAHQISSIYSHHNLRNMLLHSTIEHMIHFPHAGSILDSICPIKDLLGIDHTQTTNTEISLKLTKHITVSGGKWFEVECRRHINWFRDFLWEPRVPRNSC